MQYFKARYIGLAFLACLPFWAIAVSLDARTEADHERDAASKPAEVIDLVGVKTGDKVLDFLGGGGYYTELLSRVVGDSGSVTLHNNKAYLPYIGKELDERLANHRLKNVTKLMSEVDDFKLGNEQFDSAFFVLGYHDTYYENKGWNVTADKTFPQLYAALKPGGKLLIIDHNSAKGRGKDDAQNLHRIEDVYAKKDIESRGFKLIQQSDLLRNSNDKFDLSPFDKKTRRKTDRFVYVFEKQ